MKTLAKIKDFIQDERGASAVEYALLISGLSLATLAAVQGLGAALKTKLENLDISHAK